MPDAVLVSFYPLTIGEVIEETSQARSFTLHPRDEHAHLFDYRPGQFLTFRVPWEGRHLERCYSLSSSPSSDSVLKVTVKRVARGKISNWFNDTLRSGDVLAATPPSGRFVVRRAERPLVLFAGGSGITPIISLVKQALNDTTLSPRLFYANSDYDQVIFRRELDSLCARFPGRLDCHYHLDSQCGFANAELVAGFTGDRDNCDYFICGPGPFMELTEDVLIVSGVAPEHIFIERFLSPGEPAVLDAAVPVTAPGRVEAFRATVDGEDHDVSYRDGHTLLECMLSDGLDPPHSCRDAHCGSCMVIKKAGDVAMHKSTVLSRRDKERGYILLCQAVPLSDDVWVDCDA